MVRQLCYGGIGLISCSIIFAFVAHFTFPDLSQLIALAASLIGAAGVALIIIDVVEKTILGYILEKTTKEIVDAVKNTSKGIIENTTHNINKIIENTTHNIDNKFKEKFEIVENAEYNGLVNILPPRLDEEKGELTRKIIANEIKNSKSVRIFGISGLDFFGVPSGMAPVGVSFNAIREIIEATKRENRQLDLEIKALLMDPNSEAAKLRDKVESLNYKKGDIKKDIEVAMEGIQTLNGMAGKDFIKYRLYSIFPQAGFVLTDSYIFIEIYHYAQTKEFSEALMQKRLKATTLTTNCTGGRVPVFQFSSNSNMYVAMEKHFDSIWKYEEEKQKQNKSVP